MADEPQDLGIDSDADSMYDQAQIELNRKVMERAAQDEEFRAHMAEDPEAALAQAGLLDEAKALMASNEDGEDVEGHRWRICTYYRTCRWWALRVLWHRK